MSPVPDAVQIKLPLGVLPGTDTEPGTGGMCELRASWGVLLGLSCFFLVCGRLISVQLWCVVLHGARPLSNRAGCLLLGRQAWT